MKNLVFSVNNSLITLKDTSQIMNLKIAILVILGNTIEYYEFLLFSHIGIIIVPLFFPHNSDSFNHILSLFLFGASFLIRPIGGYIFGKISDLKSRKYALTQSVKLAVLPALGLAVLPGYEQIGVIGSVLFVLLRLSQGLALGGEYPLAGTYLIEKCDYKPGLFGSVLVASGAVGSLIGLGMAYLCISFPEYPNLWRWAFVFGGSCSLISYFMRRYLQETVISEQKPISSPDVNLNHKRLLVFLIGMVYGSTTLIPMVYTNFYATKILHLGAKYGFFATFVALTTHICLMPIWGSIFDRMNNPRKYFITSCLAIFPCVSCAIYLLKNGYVWQAQIGFVFAASMFDAPVHSIMNSLFPYKIRSRNIAFVFMGGLSIVGLFPSLFSYVTNETGFYFFPAIVIGVISLSTAIYFIKNRFFAR